MTAIPPAENKLGQETSPYLLQHKDNPVHWMPWDEAAFAKAKAENKPILLSIGYAACHWCHVMAHESFENPEIAALMNQLFVNIKVDREERPDLDQIYQQALALLGQQGGWPLTMFLTPEGEPFWGGTYFPPESRWGRPGFPDVLRGVAATYAKEPDKISRNVAALKDALTRLAESHPGGAIEPAVLDEVAERLVRAVDPVNGGIGQAPKFPQTTIFELLWRAWHRTSQAQYRTAVTNTLTRMSQGGIYDHLGGGFARYATDEAWLIPHFEKMLYDNALLIDLLSQVWQGTGAPLYEMRVRETVDWVLRDMIAEGPDGRPADAFASSLDADSEGEEGRFYVWTEAEIDALLGNDSALFKQAYGVTAAGNWEGRNILNRLHQPELRDDATEGQLAEQRQILWLARGQRIRPGWDDKVLADWNGLMIAALARAGFVFAEPAWIAAAARAFDFVAGIMSEEGRLYHSWRRGVPRHKGTLDDYAALARAAVALYEVTGRIHYLDHAAQWVDVLDEHFWDPDAGGYFFTADDAEHLLVRTKSAADSPIPSGNGMMVGVLARLYYLTGETRFRTRADALVTAFSGELQRNFVPLATLLANAELLQAARQVVVIGNPDEDDTQAMLAVLRTNFLPDAILSLVSPDSRLPAGHPAHGKGMVNGKATAYVCAGMTCLAPVTDPQSLLANLTEH